jgi:glycerol-3-phosphate O-acyltransferase
LTKVGSRIRQLLIKPIRLPHLQPFAASPGDPPIFGFNAERDDIVREVVQRLQTKLKSDTRPLEYPLNEVAIDEVRRLESQRDDEAKLYLGKWRGMVRRLGKMSDAEKLEALREVCERMARDVAGNFDPRVYALATRAVPHALSGVLKPSSMLADAAHLGRGPVAVDDLLQTEGELPLLRDLASRGTLVFVPTHSSNLDSVALGYALMREALPPVVYGAGKNLFSNPIVSFFMHNLGAYRVDRRIRAQLYKDVLKAYACVMVERGYHSLFFPGGTRSRSGMVERRLKLGLAGSAVEAFSRNAVRGTPRPVFFVPTTINYSLVLEGETLVEDWLKEAGRARYIIEDDEFGQLDRWFAFFRKLAQIEAPCVIRFGRPVDPFGNEVDHEGRSLAPSGQVLDAVGYVTRAGKPVLDARRDAAYTRELGELLAARYETETVLMGTQVVAHVLFRELVRKTPGIDLFGRLRLRGDVAITRDELRADLGATLDRLRAMEKRGEVRLSVASRTSSPDELLSRVQAAFSGYHQRTIVSEKSGIVTLDDPTMLLYYQNRLVAYAERIASSEQAGAAREIARLTAGLGGAA